MTKTPTSEQEEAIRYPGSTVITARPGSGKTYTISQKIAEESRDLLGYQGVIAISYTRKASNELKVRCERMGVMKNASFFGTIDGFCLQEIIAPFASRYANKKLNVEVIDCDKPRAFDCSNLGDIVRTSILDGKIPVYLLCAAATEILRKTKAAAKYIQSRYKSAYVDEYQDCGKAQHELVMLLELMGLRIVAVGDLDQAIYGWAGKSSRFLKELVKNERFKHFELTNNHRCHPSIVAYSLQLLGKSAQTTSLDENRVIAALVPGDEAEIVTAIERYIPGIKEKYDVEDNREIAIIARSNSTLDRVASALTIPYKRFEKNELDDGYSKWKRVFSKLLETYFSESRFAGDFVNAYISADTDVRARSTCIKLVNEYLATEISAISKTVNLALQIAELCEPGEMRDGDTEAYIHAIDSEEALRVCYQQAGKNDLSLLTYHKAKGLEFDVVFCLDAYQYVMPPYKYELMDYDAYSESLSMHYVGITRARKVCFIPMGTIRHNNKGISFKAKPSPFLSINGLYGARRSVRWG